MRARSTPSPRGSASADRAIRPHAVVSAAWLAVPTVLIGMAMHIIAGGQLMLGMVPVVMVPISVVSWLVARRGELKLPAIFALLACGQLMIHFLSSQDVVTVSSNLHTSMPVSMAHGSMSHASPWWMLAGHAAATLAAALIVRRREFLAWATCRAKGLLDVIGCLLASISFAPSLSVSRLRRLIRIEPPRLVSASVVRIHLVRGPPRLDLVGHI